MKGRLGGMNRQEQRDGQTIPGLWERLRPSLSAGSLDSLRQNTYNVHMKELIFEWDERKENANVKILVINNRYLGMVRQWQEFFYDKRYSNSHMDVQPDFVKLAESYGHVGIRVEKSADVVPALKEAIAQKDRLVFLDFITSQEENVYPMIPAGAGMNEMILV